MLQYFCPHTVQDLASAHNILRKAILNNIRTITHLSVKIPTG